MLDLKWIRLIPAPSKEGMRRRGAEVPVDELIEADKAWREKLTPWKAEGRAQRGFGGHRRAKRAGQGRVRGDRAHAGGGGPHQGAGRRGGRGWKTGSRSCSCSFPTSPTRACPTAGRRGQRGGAPVSASRRQFDFEPKPHWEHRRRAGHHRLRAGRQGDGGALRFLQGAGARLERALIQLHARPAHRGARLHRAVAALYGQRAPA